MDYQDLFDYIRSSGREVEFTVIIGLVLLILLSFLANLTRKRASSSSMDLIPAPKGRDHSHLFLGPMRHSWVLEQVNQLGPIFAVKVKGQRHLVITDPVSASRVLTIHTSPAKASKVSPWPKLPSLCSSYSEVFHYRSQTCLSTSVHCDEMWRASRKCLAHSFSAQELNQCIEAFKAVAFVLSEKVNEPGPGTTIEMMDLCRRFSLDSLGISQLAYDFSAMRQKGESLTLTLLKECGLEWERRRANPLRRTFHWAVDAWTDGYKRFQVMHQFIGTLTAEIKDRGQAQAGDTSFWSQLTQRLRDPRTAEHASDDQVMAEVGGMVMNGLDPVANSLAWTLFLLASHPEIQERACEELYKARVPHDPVSIDATKIGSLLYMDAIVRESLRLYPTGGEGLVRVVPPNPNPNPTGGVVPPNPNPNPTGGLGVEIGGFQVPPGTPVWIPCYSMHRSERNWIDPEAFDPDRWFESEGSTSLTSSMGHDGFNSAPEFKLQARTSTLLPSHQSSDKDARADEGPMRCNRGAFMPFGAGSRSCLGQHYAISAVKVAVAILLCYFKLELALDESAYAVGGGMSMGVASGSLPLIVAHRVWESEETEEVEGEDEGEDVAVLDEEDAGGALDDVMEAWIMQNRGRVTV